MLNFFRPNANKNPQENETDRTEAFYVGGSTVNTRWYPRWFDRHKESAQDESFAETASKFLRDKCLGDFIDYLEKNGDDNLEEYLNASLQGKFDIWRKAAESGIPEGQILLGTCYQLGSVVARDEQKAVEWYRRAAESGHAEGQCQLGLCYDTGIGVPENKEEAVKWYRRAAEQGHADAEHLLGGSYYYGWGVNKDKSEAERWLHKAHEHGLESTVILLHKLEREEHGDLDW